MIHFYCFCFVLYGLRFVLLFSFFFDGYVYLVFPAAFMERTGLFSLNDFGALPEIN